MARLKDFYNKEVAPALQKKFSYKSVMQIPKLDKIIVSISSGEAKDNTKMMDAICTDLGTITGQKPMICRARKSVFVRKTAAMQNLNKEEHDIWQD